MVCETEPKAPGTKVRFALPLGVMEIDGLAATPGSANELYGSKSGYITKESSIKNTAVKLVRKANLLLSHVCFIFKMYDL